jgi:serralysin
MRDFLVTTRLSAQQPSISPLCTVYASPDGNDKNSGATRTSPKTFLGAAAVTRPGSVVCLLGGTYLLRSTFKPPTSGTPEAWIVYRVFGDSPVKFLWTGGADASPMFDMNGGKFPSNPAYLEFRGLTLDGGGKAGDGFFCRGSHHLRFIENSISNTGGSGIGTIQCDYLTADHNIVDHNGYVPPDAGSSAKYYSWTSGISFNSSQWYDSYSGFHNIISNNIVTGEVDQSAKHSDGNGIILDLSDRTYNYSSANTPPALIVNNVVYGNGGRCIEAYVVSNFWIVNNTCYGNNLDSSIGRASSVNVNNSHDGYVVNNIAVAGSPTSRCYDEENVVKNIRYYRNMFFGGSEEKVPSDPRQFIQANPVFLSPTSFRLSAKTEYDKPLTPAVLGKRFMLDPKSPALQVGIDPTTLPNLSEPIIRDLKKYILTDINGTGRPLGGNPDLGAYQRTPPR